jgi:hypothetical protein
VVKSLVGKEDVFSVRAQACIAVTTLAVDRVGSVSLVSLLYG